MSILYQLTEEQEQCIEAANLGKNIKIKAFAGSGKTSTLVAIANDLQGKGLYLAYNKAIQQDAIGKFPEHVECKTAHSLAYKKYARLLYGRVHNLNIFDLKEHVSIGPSHHYSDNDIAYGALYLLRSFANSEYEEIDHHFLANSVFDTVLENSSDGNIKSSKLKNIAWDITNKIIEAAYAYWQKCVAPYSKVPMEHDFYLKMFQLSNPDFSSEYDFILFDECQDANPVLLDILSKQQCQKIYVGDVHQQIYSWRGSINAFNKINGEEYYLSQSFRFGSKIARIASIITHAKGEQKVLRGYEEVESNIINLNNCKESVTILCRTNAKIIEEIISRCDKPIFVVGGVHEMLNLAKSGFALFKGDKKAITHRKIKQFKDWKSMLRFNHQYQDAELTLLANLIKRYNMAFAGVIKKVENVNYTRVESEADFIFSTIHKSKGREWDNVIVEDDFLVFTNNSSVPTIISQEQEEMNLMYVAITRAKYNLHMRARLYNFIKKLSCYKNELEEDISIIETNDLNAPSVTFAMA